MPDSLSSLPADTILDRFWSKVDTSGDCWLWTAARTPEGYGTFHITHDKALRAPRFAYEVTVGPIPDGLTLDHLCSNPPCVNPAHLEPVTMWENLMRSDSSPAHNARKTHCPQGHPYGEYVRGRKRYCRVCNAEAQRRRYHRQRALNG